jgi:hypothetical protein
MSFHVIWPKSAVDSLAEAYLQAFTRNDGHIVTERMVEVEQLLKENPIDASESREEGERILLALPLVVRFRIEESLKMVYVMKVRLAPQKE